MVVFVKLLKSIHACEWYNTRKTLRHDKRAVPSHQQDSLHLAHIPDYLIPRSYSFKVLAVHSSDMHCYVERSLRVLGADGAKQAGARKRKRVGGSDQRRNKASDPLQSFEAAPEAKIFTKGDDLGAATSGRRKWKMKQHKVIVLFTYYS